MKELFTFDVRLKDLMNLGSLAKESPKLNLVFIFLKEYWYSLKNKKEEKEREDTVRVGSVSVYLDDDKHLCMKFTTRFSLLEKFMTHVTK